jgi:chemotaxis signal transduction protein
MNSSSTTVKPEARACLFELGDLVFAVPGRYTRQVHTLETITRVPRAPQDLLGVFAVRGQIFPLVRLESTLNLRSNDAAPVLAVQVEFEGKNLAFVIDKVLGFNPISAQLEAGTDGRFAALSLGQVSIAGRDVHVLDVAKLMQSLAARIAGRELAQA